MTDSAGVRITTSPDVARTFAVVDSVPRVSIGGPNATGPAQFDNVMSVDLDTHDRIWVADAGSAQMRIFNADGSSWKTLGGKGQGPGEFLRIRILGRFHGDTVAVWDRSNRRLSLYDPNGDLLAVRVLPPGGIASPRAYGVFRDGSLVVQVPKVYQAFQLQPHTILRDSARFVLLHVEHASTTPLNAEAAGPIWLWTGRSQLPIPFTENPGVAVASDRVYVVDGDAFRVRVFGRDGLEGIHRIERAPRPVTPASLREYRERMKAYLRPAQLPELLRLLDRPERPKVLPAYSSVIAVGDHVWAEVYQSGRWNVFDARGAYVGDIVMPAGFDPMSANAREVAGVWLDREGVEYVRVYAIEKR